MTVTINQGTAGTYTEQQAQDFHALSGWSVGTSSLNFFQHLLTVTLTDERAGDDLSIAASTNLGGGTIVTWNSTTHDLSVQMSGDPSPVTIGTLTDAGVTLDLFFNSTTATASRVNAAIQALQYSFGGGNPDDPTGNLSNANDVSRGLNITLTNLVNSDTATQTGTINRQSN